MKRIFTFAIILLALVKTVSADDGMKACFASALEANSQAVLKLFETAGPIMSPDAQIMRRRLDEKYCLEVTACGLEGQIGEVRTMMASALFSQCLKEQSIE